MTTQTRVALTRMLMVAALLAVTTAAAAEQPVSTAAQSKVLAEPLQPLAEAPVPHISNCLSETGSRIPSHSADGCLNVPGSSYDSEALRSTGQTSLGAALRQLDPSIH